MKKIILLFILLSCFFFGCVPKSSVSYNYASSTPVPPHKLLVPNATFSKVTWERQFYPSSIYFGSDQCATVDGVLIAIGSLDGIEPPKVYAFDGKSGNVLWTHDDAFVMAISKYGLFVGDNKNNVLLIHPKDGETIWQIKLNNIRNIRKMMYEEELLFVNTDGFSQYFVIDSSGKTVSEYREESDFYNEYKDLHFIPNLPFSSIASGDIYIRQFGDILYSVAAYKRSTDELLWKSKTYSISNYLPYKEYILWVSPDDKLIKADKTNGQILDKTEIIPSINFFDNNPDKQHAGYYLCGDDKENLIYLLLGDSRQLFSISVLE